LIRDNSQLATRLTSVFEKLDPRTLLSGDTLEAQIVNNGTGYELSITVDRTELSAQEQVVPIALTNAIGETIEGLPASFSLRVPVGAGSSSGTIPLPAGVFNPGEFEGTRAIGIHRVDAVVETEIVEFVKPTTTQPSSESLNISGGTLEQQQKVRDDFTKLQDELNGLLDKINRAMVGEDAAALAEIKRIFGDNPDFTRIKLTIVVVLKYMMNTKIVIDTTTSMPSATVVTDHGAPEYLRLHQYYFDFTNPRTSLGTLFHELTHYHAGFVDGTNGTTYLGEVPTKPNGQIDTSGTKRFFDENGNLIITSNGIRVNVLPSGVDIATLPDAYFALLQGLGVFL
jgi:hypothetical protein